MSDPESAVGPRWPETLKTASENTALSLELRRACVNAVGSLKEWGRLDRQVYDLTERLEQVKRYNASLEADLVNQRMRHAKAFFAADLVRKIKAEMNCRVEHGAKDEGGHLSAMLGLIARWEKAMGVEP